MRNFTALLDRLVVEQGKQAARFVELSAHIKAMEKLDREINKSLVETVDKLSELVDKLESREDKA